MGKNMNKKNNLVLSLRDHLMNAYSTRKHYTPGESDFECVAGEGNYSSVSRNPSKPRNIGGFYFRKDLCELAPSGSQQLTEDVKNFLDRSGADISLTKQGDLNLVFGDEEYLITSHIEEGHAGEISVHFMEMPSLRIAV